MKGIPCAFSKLNKVGSTWTHLGIFVSIETPTPMRHFERARLHPVPMLAIAVAFFVGGVTSASAALDRGGQRLTRPTLSVGLTEPLRASLPGAKGYRTALSAPGAQYHPPAGAQYQPGTTGRKAADRAEQRLVANKPVISRTVMDQPPLERSVHLVPNRRSEPRPILSVDHSRNTRLMVRIGMLLGLVYLAFLVVWFWATRLRTRPRPPAPV